MTHIDLDVVAAELTERLRDGENAVALSNTVTFNVGAAIAEQLQIANALAILNSPGGLLIEEDLSSAKGDVAKSRISLKNQMRRLVREGMEIEGR